MSPTAQRTSQRADERLDVRKTYKLYIGGKFPRSESGRSYEVTDSRGKFLANAAQGSRKDARDAVVAALGRPVAKAESVETVRGGVGHVRAIRTNGEAAIVAPANLNTCLIGFT